MFSEAYGSVCTSQDLPPPLRHVCTYSPRPLDSDVSFRSKITSARITRARTARRTTWTTTPQARRGRIMKKAVRQLTDGIFLYRAEQEAAAMGAGGGGASPSADASYRGAGTLPGSVEEVEAFLNLPVVGRDDDDDDDDDDSSGADDEDGEEWVDTPLPGSAVGGALNMATFGATAEEDDTPEASSLRLELEAEGGWSRGGGGGGGGVVSGSDGEDSDSEDSDDDHDDRPGVEHGQYRPRSMRTEERSYQHPAAAAGGEEAAATRSRSSSTTDGEEVISSDGGGAKGMKNTVRRLLARRGWTFKSGPGGTLYHRTPTPARAHGAAPTRAEVRKNTVDSKT